MNDIRRNILWVIFGVSLVILWDHWQVHNGHKATFFPSTTAPTEVSMTTAPAAIPVAPAALPGTAAAILPEAVVATATVKELVVVTTDVLKLTFSTEGGSIAGAEFVKYVDKADKSKNFVLLDESKDRFYVAQTGLIGAAGSAAMPNHKTVMTLAAGERTLKDGADELVLRFESPELGGVKLIKTYTVKRGAYDVGVKHELVNNSAVAVAPQVYLQLVRDGNKPPGESSFYSTFTGPAVYTSAKKYQKVEFAEIEKYKDKLDKLDMETQSTDGYVAMVQHYFASAWLLGDSIKRDLFARRVDTNLYAVGMITPLDSIAPGSSKVLQARFFAGPQEEKMLDGLTPGLELLKDYGMFKILAKPLYWLLDRLHDVVQNWGWAIVALVVLLKIAFYWLNAKSMASMAKMKAINPRIMEMRERLKDSPQQMQQEMMRIYREEKVNPMGGCLPILIQMPVFIALYWVLLSSVEMRNAPWAMWIHDLSAPDPFFILPVVMTLTTLLQTALNPAPPDPMQAKMMWFMPLIFSVMFFFFPSGLVLYYIANNILTIAQQWVINVRMGVPPKFNLPKF